VRQIILNFRRVTDTGLLVQARLFEKKYVMKASRRDFIKTSVLLGSGILVKPSASIGTTSEKGKFLSRIGVCTGIANHKILFTAGYSYIESDVRGFLAPAEDEKVFQANLALLNDSKLPVEACNSFLPGNLKCVGPVPLHDEILKYSETAFKRARTAGVKTIVFGSGGARAIPEGFSREEARKQFIGLCSKMASIAAKYGIIISLEPLNSKECNFINSVAEGGEIVKEVNHQNFRLLADIYHMLMEKETPGNIRKYGHLLVHTHIAEKEGRNAPGVGKEDFTEYLKALKDVDYKGRLSIECRWQDMSLQAGDALQALKSQIASI
jgi:sugar phosphate isomerase/epimerase